MNITYQYYGVRLGHKTDAVPFLATGSGSVPALFYWRRDAVKFKHELAAHRLRGQVVRVEVTYRFES